MRKAIATPPGQKTKYITLTAAEQAARELEEAQWLADTPMREWKDKMGTAETDMPRWAEDIIGVLDPVARDRLAPETLDKYNNKKILREQKPV